MPKRPPGPDFSPVDTMDKAEALVREGVLERLSLPPPGPSGSDAAEVFVFGPVQVARTG